ncbi:MAG: HAMP domain-containing protein [Planctomycetota bacterium]|nr:MAG: HAMP domain-containing protein [Planctomycetota bacterium]
MSDNLKKYLFSQSPSPPRRLFGIRTKIVVPFVLLFLLCLLLVGSIAVNQVTGSVERRLDPRRLGELVSRAGFPLNEASLERIRKIIDCEIVSFSADFDLLATTLPEEKRGPLREWLKRRGASFRPSEMMRDSGFPGYYFVSHEVTAAPGDRSQPAGLLLAVSESVMKSEKMKTVRPIIIAAVIGTVLIIIIGLYISHTITRPLRELTSFASELRVEGSEQINLDKQIVVYSRDETRDLANAFNAMLERLRSSESQLVEGEKMAAIGSIATGMAHEIRNPLSSIRMTVQLLLRRTEDEKIKSELELILREIERLSFTLSELLIFARPPRPGLAGTDVARLVDETLGILRPQFEHHDVEVDRDYAADLPPVALDHNHFKQVLMNLMINSIEAMPGGGGIAISMSVENGDFTFRMRDTGEGVPPELGDRIFDPFFTTKGGGSGLGLAVTKIIVESHDGTIQYSSDSGGTEFTIRIPHHEIEEGKSKESEIEEEIRKLEKR